MPKLIEAKLWDKILSVLGAGGQNKDKFLSQVKKSDPQLARQLDNWEGDFVNLLQATRRAQVKNGLDTKNVDALIQKYKG